MLMSVSRPDRLALCRAVSQNIKEPRGARVYVRVRARQLIALCEMRKKVGTERQIKGLRCPNEID
jgi:hypothetical protein